MLEVEKEYTKCAIFSMFPFQFDILYVPIRGFAFVSCMKFIEHLTFCFLVLKQKIMTCPAHETSKNTCMVYEREKISMCTLYSLLISSMNSVLVFECRLFVMLWDFSQQSVS